MTINEVVIAGRLTKDPELRKTQSDTSVAGTTVALDRYMGNGKDNETDFVPIVAWGNVAEFLAKHFFKGKKIIVKGNLHSRTYQDNDGNNRFVLEVWVEKIDFADEKKQGESQPPAAPPQNQQPPRQNNNQPRQQQTLPPWMQTPNQNDNW